VLLPVVDPALAVRVLPLLVVPVKDAEEIVGATYTIVLPAAEVDETLPPLFVYVTINFNFRESSLL
jgi:hypothetical protein